MPCMKHGTRRTTSVIDTRFLPTPMEPGLTAGLLHYGDYNEDHDQHEGQGERPGRPGK